MATILAHITVKAGQEQAWEDVCSRLYDATHAGEADVARYEYWRGEHDRTYYTLLSFTDLQAFIDHQASAHHIDAGIEMRNMFEAFWLEWVDPVTTASPLPPTNAQEARPEADEVWLKYHQDYAPNVRPWWGALRG